MYDINQQWNKCLEILKDNLPASQYDAWFGRIAAVSFSDNKVTLKVPSAFYAEQIEERYLDLLGSALKRVFGPNVKLAYKFNTVAGDDQTAQVIDNDNASQRLIHNLKTIPHHSANPFNNDNHFEDIDPQLNPHYTFENYCSSMSNKLALTVAKAIASHPQDLTFIPFYVFGSTGVGKTHLLQAIGVKIKEDNPRKRVLYLTARVFFNQYTTAVTQNKVNDFINFYQSIDVLILDDIQEFAGKTKTQNTFFHIFNFLHDKQKLLIMSSDCRPSELDGMVPRLISRFKKGMTAELEKPDYQLRRDVLAVKAAQDGLEISDDVLDYIAAHVTESVRDLEGIVVSLLAHATVLNQNITIDLARQVIGNAVKINKRQVSFEMIAETVASHYNIDTDLLYGKSRKREISDARQLLMYLAKREAQMSSTNIGMKLSRTHATVLHACTQIEQRMSIEKDFKQEVEAIEQELRYS